MALGGISAFAQATANSQHPDAIQSYLQPRIDDHTLAGAVTLVATRDRIVYLQPVGYRDLAAKAPMPANAMFWIASTSKPMTVTAFMMLVDEGKVSLDDPVEKYLPEFHGQMVKAEGGIEGCAGCSICVFPVGSRNPSDSDPRDSEPHRRPALQVRGSARCARHVIAEGFGA